MKMRIGASVGFLVWLLTLFGLFLPPWVGWGIGAVLATWFALRLILFLEHNVILVFGALMAISGGTGSWAKGVWVKSGAILPAEWMGRIVLILTAILAAIATIYYIRGIDTYRRSRANLTKEQIVAEEEPGIVKKIVELIQNKRGGEKEKTDEIVLILGDSVENRAEIKKREMVR